ncbi:MAG: carbohydrate binding domain-containing protein [Candidatus Solibacter sp.]
MPATRRPLVYMAYTGLRNMSADWSESIKAELLKNPDAFVIPQIGLSLTGGATDHYEQQVANGDYDREIDYLVEGLRRLATPVYLRIGYEFNGVNWNGYQPTPYKLAFLRITNKLRAADLEVATVWDAAIDGVKNYFDYYPGDAAVDWFGMNFFAAASFKDPSLPAFFAEARARHKPVMIGETTPQTVGAQAGQASWSTWFVPFFALLGTNPEIKQFNYINWDWAYWAKVTGSNWADWGDARLELDTATYVRDLYVAELADPVVLHANSETSFRRLLGFNDTNAPPAVTDLTVTAVPGGVNLAFTGVKDPSGIARYVVYRGNTLLTWALPPGIVDSTVDLGTSAYTIAAMDRAGNLGPRSNAVVVSLEKIERLSNGGFESGLNGWRYETFSNQVSSSAIADTTAPISGTASVRLTVSKSSGTNWHAQLRQFFNMTQGRSYTVRFKARASAAVSLPFVIQQVDAPNTIHLNRAAAVTATVASVEYSFVAPATQTVAASFYFGNINGAVWVDDLSVEESDPRVNVPRISAEGIQSGASYLPGIVPGSWLAIKGSNLSQVAQDTWDRAIVNGRLPTSLDGVNVRIGGQLAFVYFVSPGQINVLAPEVPVGSALVTVTTPNGTSDSVTAAVVARAPAFFLWPGNQAVATRQDGSLSVKEGTFPGTTTVAAHPGDVIILWGTGFGATTPAVVPGTQVPSDRIYNCVATTVIIGSADAQVFGCALSPGSAGLYQVAIQVPASLADGDYALKTIVGGIASPDGVTLSVKK